MPLNGRKKYDWMFWFAVLLAVLFGMVMLSKLLFMPA